ncbi:MAG: multifunctional 2',3'-cyclic-nucleotide 2'-phosphodiesterase/5'-nucleotidase/3'-nucleotidase [Candidatus Cloacimonas sp. SDB]|nr:MAG: multifunctional 2',3'-cyclic-nucleotide 2'-phosphodiesterase/5'-nucleotidase/3'-nucleotidase [Candidatus Cloacimonas sp. SDB]
MNKKNYILGLILLTVFFLPAEDLILDVLFTNDIHGGIDKYQATFMNPEFPPDLGGGGSAATYIKQVRSYTDGKFRDNLLIDAGDFFQGRPIGTMNKGKSIVEYMNLIDYDLSVIGNHEYDIGEEELIKTLKNAEFPFLSCNIYRKGTDQLVEYVQPYLIIEKMGVKLGIIGVTTTDTEKMSFPENIKNVEFRSSKAALLEYIPKVKALGADLIIVVGHMGLPYDPEPAYQDRYLEPSDEDTAERHWGHDAQELAHEVPGIDVFFGGHMHKGFPEPWEDPQTHTLVMQGWAYGSGIGHVMLKIDKETKTLSGYEAPALREGLLVTLFEEEFIPDQEIADTIQYMQNIAEAGMDEYIGEAAVYLSKTGAGAQNVIGNLICEAMLENTDADFAFLNLGGIRGEIRKGPITYRDVFNVMPFDNQVVTFEMNGEFLKDIIEMRVSSSRHGLRVAGVKVIYSKDRENYDRVTSLYVGGEPWEKDKIYKITTTDFLLEGNAGLAMLTKIPEKVITRHEKSLRDLIVDYIKINTPVSAEIDDRWIRDDKSELSEELELELNK